MKKKFDFSYWYCRIVLILNAAIEFVLLVDWQYIQVEKILIASGIILGIAILFVLKEINNKIFSSAGGVVIDYIAIWIISIIFAYTLYEKTKYCGTAIMISVLIIETAIAILVLKKSKNKHS